MELKDLKIIVTGAGGGMGAYFARVLHEAGASVVAGDLKEDGLAELPEGVHHRRLDVTSEDDCRSFVEWASTTMGGVNSIINSAGIIRDGLLVRKSRSSGEITTMSRDQFQSVIDVNLTGTVLMTREVVETMVKNGFGPGVVVNISSVARHGNRGQTNYVATKAAVAANAVTWAREFAPFGIRAVAIAPGMVETPMTQGMNQKARDALVANIPVGRIGLPHDLWQAVKFALECDYFNGTTVDVHGGLSM